MRSDTRGLRLKLAANILALLALAPPLFAAQPSRDFRTPVALVSVDPNLGSLQSCVAENVAATGPVLRIERLTEGLEFRTILLGSADAQQTVTIVALLKPNPSVLMESHHGDAEAQPAAIARLHALLRIHVGTRAWVWQGSRVAEICREAADWINRLRAQPILFDHLRADGEPR